MKFNNLSCFPDQYLNVGAEPVRNQLPVSVQEANSFFKSESGGRSAADLPWLSSRAEKKKKKIGK